MVCKTLLAFIENEKDNIDNLVKLFDSLSYLLLYFCEKKINVTYFWNVGSLVFLKLKNTELKLFKKVRYLNFIKEINII